jgi:outer membrane lipoprotein-sorting protein
MYARRALPAFLVAAALISTALADAQSEPWIAKARAAVGDERALSQVKSIHFSGTLDTVERVQSEANPAETTERPIRLAIDIIFQKPYQQRLTLRSEKVSRVTALDGYDGWMQRIPDISEPKKWILDFMPPAEIKRLRANTWENLNFYRGIEKRGGKVTFQGDASVEGRECVKINFAHDNDIYFTRYFDKSTGRLVKTETENGAEIREEGELTVDGLRFPRKLISKSPQGIVTTITFEQVKVNETFPAEYFAFPDMVAN